MSETCRVSFQNKFEKLVYLVGFIVIIRLGLFIPSPERLLKSINSAIQWVPGCVF